MDLDSLKIVNLEANLSSLDSLMTTQIAAQQAKIDSLAMIVHDIGIEKGFFSSMLSIQTGFFSLLIVITVTLIGFISLRFVKRKVKKLEDRTNQKIEGVDTRVEFASQQSEYNRYHLFHTLAYINSQNMQFFYACLWALRASNCKYINDDLKKINRQITKAWNFASSSEKENINQDYLDQINENVKNLLKIDGVEKDKLVYIRDTINKIYYSPKKKSPPEAKAESSD